MATSPNGGFNLPFEGQTLAVTEIAESLTDLDEMTAGQLELTGTVGADVTLSNEQARKSVIKVSYVLNTNISLKIPTTGASRVIVVWNNTTGASWTLTVKTTAGGSTGVLVTRGKRALLFHDGTHVYDITESGDIGLSQADGDTRYVNVTGDTMTGDLTISKTGAILGLIVKTTTDHASFVEASTNNLAQQMRMQTQGAVAAPFVGTISNHDLAILVNNTYMHVFKAGGAIKVSVYASLPGAYDADSVYLYAEGASAELKVRDEAGNITTLSPHAQDAPAWLYDAEDVQPPQMSREVNVYAGTIRFENATRFRRLMEMQLEGQFLPLDPLKRKCRSVETFDEYNLRMGFAADSPRRLVQEDWDVNQERMRVRRAAQRQAWASAKAEHDAAVVVWEVLSAEEKAIQPRPTFELPPPPPAYVKKPRPAWLAV